MGIQNTTYVGKFIIKDKEFTGQVEIDNQTNSILLRCNEILKDDPIGAKVNLDKVDEIRGELNNGNSIRLLGTKCVDSPIFYDSHQSYCFLCDSILDCGKKDKKDYLFNEYAAEIENGLAWINSSNIEAEFGSNTIKITDYNKSKHFSGLGLTLFFLPLSETKCQAFHARKNVSYLNTSC